MDNKKHAKDYFQDIHVQKSTSIRAIAFSTIIRINILSKKG